ncbi:MAG: sigma-54-dependent Fis family transcriptional regulator [Gemmatimonadales bacterium]|nr:MAG: sigma-54-dependent Fis family transcriptional regulator [Gemmatimonadales bacterium]
MERSILVVDDDERIRASLPGALQDEVDQVRVAESGERALAELAEHPVDIVLTDVRMPGMDGLELLTLLRQRLPNVSVILMTAYDDLPTVALAMREGAVDFLVKPLELNSLRGVIRRVLEDRTHAREAGGGPSGAAEAGDVLVGRDPAMVGVFKLVGQVAAGRTNVVIRGESGTGKELVARAIHRASPYAREPFVAVNCTALPGTLLESELFGHVKGAFTGAESDHRGRFALAGRGTIFLDEIGDTSLDFQAKLLRVLQEHEFYPVGAERPEVMEARVIAATHRDLEALVKRETFREDLYFRLRVVEIPVPPLRDRPGDIHLLAEHFLRKVSANTGRPPPVLTDEAVQLLSAHTWPGNVRELENCLTRAVLLASGGVVREEHLGLGGVVADPSDYGSLQAVERGHVEDVLRATRGYKSRAAEVLGISRPRLDRLIEKYDLAHLTRGGRPGGGDED